MLTLVVEISQEGDKLKMGAFERSKGIDVTLKHYSECMLGKNTESLCEEITNLFNRAVRNKESGDSFVDELKKNGRALFDQLLTIEVKKAIKNTKANFLLISIDEHLVQIPWELLHDGEEFLCIRFAIGRSVKTKQKAHESKFRDINIPIKMLVVADPSGDLNSAYEEGISIRNELDKRKNKAKVLSKTGEIYTDFIKRNIRDYDIIHYAGHAEYDSTNPSDSGWVLKDGKFTAKDIVALGATAPMPSIVFSNACQSGKTQEWLVSKEFGDEIYGIANAFLLAGVRHYIGTFWKVLDNTCLDFANEFYKNVTDGLPIGEAVRLARIKLVHKYGYHSIIWSSYMLYGDPSINLFFVPSTRKILKETVFQRQIIILSIILGSIIGTGILGFALYRNYILRPVSEEKLPWVQKNIIAIMPFENLMKDKEIDWIGGGIANIIAMKMGRLEKINVIDRIQIENIWREIKKVEYIDKESALKIANIVGADRIIMGAFQKIGDDIRVTASLINVKDGGLIGTIDASNKYNNLFALEDSIALNITEKLNIKISDAERVELSKAIPTKNISAFEFMAKATDAFISKDIQRAKDYCKKALDIDSNYIQANLATGYLYEWSGDLESAKIYYKKGIELSETTKDKNLLMAANFNLGKLLVRIGQIQEGIQLQNQALKIAKSLNDQQNYASILYNLGISYIMNSEFDKAKNAILESKTTFEKLKNKFGLVASYVGLGMYYSFGKEIDLEKARQNLEEAMRICEMLNSKEGLPNIYSMLGGYYYAKQELDEAIVYHSKSLKISIEISNKFSEATAYDGLGRAYEAKGEFGIAQEYYQKNLNLSKETGNRIGVKNALYSLASLYLRQLRNDEATKYFNLLIDEAEKDRDNKNLILGLRWIANAYSNMGRYSEAIDKYQEALTFKEELFADKFTLVEVYLGLGFCNGQIKNTVESNKYFNLALTESKATKEDVTIAHTYQNIAKCYENTGMLDKAIQNYKEAIEYAKKAELKTTSQQIAKMILESTYFGLAECYSKQNDRAQAIEYYKKALPIAEEIGSLLVNVIKSNLYSIDQEVVDERENIVNPKAEQLYKQASDYFYNGESEKALAIAKEAYQKEPSNKRISGLVCLVYESLGKYEDAIAIHLNYVKMLDNKKDIIEIISQYSWVGGNYRHIGKLDKAKEYYEKALSLAERTGDEESVGSVCADYSMVLGALGQDEKAIEFANRGIELSKDPIYLANAYQVLSNIYMDRKDIEKAVEYANLNLKIKEDSGSMDLGRSYALLGGVYKDIDIVKSLEYLNKAVEFFENKKQLSLLGNTYQTIGSVYEQTQQIDKALEYFNKSLEISEKLNDKWTTLANYLGLEGAYYKNKNYKLSEEFRNKFINLNKELGNDEELGQMYAVLAYRYDDTDKNKEEKYLLLSNNILEKFKSTKNLKSLFLNYTTLGYMYYSRKDFDKAMNYYQKAIDIAESGNITDKNMLGLTYKSLGDCARIKGNFDKTLEVYKKAKSIFAEIEGREKFVDSLYSEIKRIEYLLSIKDIVKDYDDFIAKAISYHKDHKWELALEHYKGALMLAKEIKDSGKDELIIKDMSEREKWLNNEITRIESFLKEVETSKKTKPADYLEANAILYVRQNKLEAALENLEKALNIYEGANSKKQIGFTKMRIGLVYLTKNDVRKAEELFKEARDVYKQTEDKEFIGLIHHGVFGILFEKKGEYNKAEEEYNAAISLLKETESVKTYTVAYNNCLGSVNYKKKNYKKSLEYYQKALETGKEIEDPSSICLTETMMAYINLMNGYFGEANDVADKALTIADRLDDKEVACITSLIKGKIFMKQNNYEKANEFINKAFNYAELTDSNKLKLVTYLNLAMLAELQSNKIEYEKWLDMIKEKDNFKCIIDNKIAIDKVEALFKEIIEEKDFFKRIWL